MSISQMNIAVILKSEYRNTKYETNPKFEFSNFQNKKPPISYIKTKRLVWNFGHLILEFVSTYFIRLGVLRISNLSHKLNGKSRFDSA